MPSYWEHYITGDKIVDPSNKPEEEVITITIPKEEVTGGTISMPTLKKKAEELTMPVFVKKVTQVVKVSLTADERDTYGRTLAAMHIELEGIREEFKTLAAELKERAKTHSMNMRKYVKALASGMEERMVDTEERLSYEFGTVSTYYKGKLVSTRQMTNEEKQVPIDVLIEQGATVKMPPKGKPFSEQIIEAMSKKG